MDAQKTIEALRLEPHPEGGFFRESFRSTQRVTLCDGRVRSAGTAIYFLLPQGTFSTFHRIPACEVWHHYAGGPLLLHQLGVGTVRLDESTPQAFVRAGAWQAAEPEDGAVLCGCTVSPGFEFEDLEIARAADIARLFPKEAALIRRLCTS
ncbi:MAG: cupin domain-containing protein [Deltaproteobacteria bacterium]|nr:cupin domain-containing protein [Deltaproteobacteria bacterium]